MTTQKERAASTNCDFDMIRESIVTKNELDRKITSNVQLLLKEIDRQFAGTNQRFNHVIDELKGIKETIGYSVSPANKEIADLERRVCKLENKNKLLKKNN